MNFNYWKKCWNLEESIIKKGGGATFDLGAWTGKEERVQSAVIEEGYPKLKLLKFSVSIIVVLCITSVKYII